MVACPDTSQGKLRAKLNPLHRRCLRLSLCSLCEVSTLLSPPQSVQLPLWLPWVQPSFVCCLWLYW